MNGKKDLFMIVFWCVVVAGYLLISGVKSVGVLILTLISYIVISYLIYRGWKYFRSKASLDMSGYAKLFLYKAALLFIVIGCLIGGFVGYHNEISPATMPTYYLGNGEKQIIFQAMIHIGSPEFYDHIQQELVYAKQDGYVYFFEGVKPGTPENNTKFNQALGIEFSPELYKNFSELYGVVAQDQQIFLGLENDLDFNIDMNLDEIMELYDEKITPPLAHPSQEGDSATSPLLGGDGEGGPIDINAEILETLSDLSPSQKKVLVYINQAFLNFFIKNEGLRTAILERFGNQDIFSVILDDRNKLLAKSISESEYPHIFITYGLLHFDGVFELLQQDDPNWRLHRVENLFPIQ